MAVLDPVKVIIDNYPEGQVEYLEVDNNVENPEPVSYTHLDVYKRQHGM